MAAARLHRDGLYKRQPTTMRSSFGQRKLTPMDKLSRLPLNEGRFEGHYDEPCIFNTAQECLPVTSTYLRTSMLRDRVLSKALRSEEYGPLFLRSCNQDCCRS